jgi:hypothetical protein
MIPVIDALQLGDYTLALTATANQLIALPVIPLLEIPIPITDDSLSRRGMGVDL